LAPTLGSSLCDCGREAQPAVTADGAPAFETVVAGASSADVMAPVSLSGALTANSGIERAPPPTPPVFVVNCAFLT
jgi:hypothetical protein